jgi:hypothetical protein
MSRFEKILAIVGIIKALASGRLRCGHGSTYGTCTHHR